MSLLLAFLLLAVPSPPLAAAPAAVDAEKPTRETSPQQQVADSIYTIATTRYTYEWVSDIQAWQTRELSLETFLPVGTLVIDLDQQQRFGRNEISGAVHYWGDLWGDSYGHIQTKIAPNALTMPRFTIGGELYEVYGNWEISGWFEWRRYPSANVYIMGPQIARYLDQWYVRMRTSIVEREGKWVVTEIAAARYYYLGTSDSFVEGQIGYGRNVELVEATPEGDLEVARTYFATARVRHFFTQNFGATFTAKYSSEVYERTGITAGLLARW